jgi:hypothetical protein
MARCRFKAGLSGGTSGPCQPAPHGFAIESSAAPVRFTADCSVSGNTQGSSRIPALPAIASPGSVARGSPLTLTFSGNPGTAVLVYLDASHGHLPLPGIDGPFLLSLNPVPLPLLMIGASGSLPLTLPVPMDPAIANLFLLFQGVALDPQKTAPSLTNPGDVRIR